MLGKREKSLTFSIGKKAGLNPNCSEERQIGGRKEGRLLLKEKST